MAYVKNQSYWTNTPCHRFKKKTKRSHMGEMREGIQRFRLSTDAEEFKINSDSDDSIEEGKDKPEGAMAPGAIAVLGKNLSNMKTRMDSMIAAGKDLDSWIPRTLMAIWET